MSDPLNHYLGINLVSFRTFGCPLFTKQVSWLELFCRFLQQDSSNTPLHTAAPHGYSGVLQHQNKYKKQQQK